MTDKKLRDITVEFERLTSKGKKLKANKKYTDDEREAIIKALKEEFINALLSLEYVIEEPGYRDRAFEVQESFCLKAKEVDIIKDKEELERIFKEIYEIKKTKEEDDDELKDVKKDIDKAISKRDINKLAYIRFENLKKEDSSFAFKVDNYFMLKVEEAELMREVSEILEDIEKRELEKTLRELERKERIQEYKTVSKRAGSFHKTLDALYKDKPLVTPEFESPGICEKCGFPITDTFYYHDIKTGVVMHTDCAKKVLDIKKKIKK